MRGRTNASNGGIFLNATTDTFEVATGSSIVAGDFVEYKYNQGVIPLNTSFSRRERAFLVDDASHTFIALFSGYPTLFTYIDGAITVVNTYATACTNLERFNATHYMVRFRTTNKIALIECTTSAISLVYEYATAEPATTIETVHSNDTTIGVLASGSLYIFSTDSNYTTLNLITSFSISGTLSFVGATSTKIVVRSYASSAYTIRIYDAATGALLDSFLGQALTYLSNIVINDRYFVGYEVTNSTGVNYKFIIAVVDIVDKDTIARTTFEDSTTWNSIVAIASDINSNNEFIIVGYKSYTAEKGWWFRFDTNLLSFEFSDATELPDSQDTPAVFTFGAKQYGYMIPNLGYLNMDTTTNKIIVGDLTDTVQEWSGGQNPMGVAKQSGNAGDTIAVYIPQVNS